MEYEFYLEQLYTRTGGKVKARILPAVEAEKLGYEDGQKTATPEGMRYIDGIGSEAAARNYLSDMVGVVMV